MTLTSRDRRALILGGATLALAGLYIFALEPGLAWYDGLTADHGKLAGQVAELHKRNQMRAWRRRQLAKWEEEAGPFTLPKPYDEQVTTVGREVMAAAQKSGLEIKNSSWAAPRVWSANPSVALATMQIDAETQWQNVFKFIAAAYRVPGVLSVESLGLTGDPKKGGKLTVRLSLSVLVQPASEGDT